MRFDKVSPAVELAPYIKHYVIAENALATEYKVFPSTSLVMGFQYKGTLMAGNTALSISGITGITDTYKVFRNSPGIGTILVYFTATGLSHFTTQPAHELFDQSIGIDHLFPATMVRAVEEQLALASSDKQRIHIINQFFLSQLRDLHVDKLVIEAVKQLCQSNGLLQIKTLATQLYTSQSPLEKRFRKLVGTTPKKFASIVRFNSLIQHLDKAAIHYEYDFFDQAHFIKDFKKFTGSTPEEYRKTIFYNEGSR